MGKSKRIGTLMGVIYLWDTEEGDGRRYIHLFKSKRKPDLFHDPISGSLIALSGNFTVDPKKGIIDGNSNALGKSQGNKVKKHKNRNLKRERS